MNASCVHSCKGMCNALETAEHRESEAIKEYRKFASECDYPDVRQLLQVLIAERERGVKLLRETREMLRERFAVLDRINESFT